MDFRPGIAASICCLEIWSVVAVRLNDVGLQLHFWSALYSSIYLIKYEFAELNVTHLAFLGPLVGAAIRPVGG